MCGIIGYYGEGQIESLLIDKLRLLEYRGYDSAGIAVKSQSGIRVTKEVGFIDNLQKKVVPLPGAVLGIGHTRWATHGEPSVLNAHPHVSEDGKWAVVHNGIIENYESLREKLRGLGYGFKSRTDTETIAKLLEYTSARKGLGFMETLITAAKSLDGSYALGVINRDSGSLYFAKNQSPLYVAKGDGGYMIASDPMCFVGFSQSYYVVDDGDFGMAGEDGLKFFDGSCQLIEKSEVSLSLAHFDLTNNFDHFMLKEIYDSAQSLDDLIDHYGKEGSLNMIGEDLIKGVNRIKVVGCGTAYNAALVGAKMIEEKTRIECTAYVASEFRYATPTFDKNTLVIFVSQSGETADTLAALELARSRGAKTLSVVNVPYSALATKADVFVPIKAGVEVAVASTKAYVCMVTVLYVLSLQLNKLISGEDFDLGNVKALKDLLSVGKRFEYEKIADLLINADRIMMIGRGYDFYTAKEACMKIVGTSYLNANAYFAGELKHGPIALVEKGTYVVVFATEEDVLSKTLSNAEETAARGAKLILCTPINLPKEKAEKFDRIIKVSKIDCPLQTVLNIIPWQLIAYHIAVKKGLNPDRPRNLAKSVTVE